MGGRVHFPSKQFKVERKHDLRVGYKRDQVGFQWRRIRTVGGAEENAGPGENGVNNGSKER